MAYVAPSTRVNGDIITATIWNQDVVDNSIAHAVITQDADIIALAGLTSAADKVPYFTGSGAAAVTTVTGAARGVLDDTTVAAMRTSMAAYGRVFQQVFIASGTYTPTSGMLHAIIECIGGGGGGGGVAGVASATTAAAGGGAGGYSRKYVTAADVGASKAVTIGAAGSGATAGANAGGSGGDTSVGVLCVGKGGTGGGATSNSLLGSGGAGGIAGTGDVAGVGERGANGLYAPNTTFVPGGNGANSLVGGGGAGGTIFTTGTAAGSAGSGYGSGGGGALAVNSASNVAGGAGTVGIVIITEFLPQ